MGLDNFRMMQVCNELLLQYYISSNFGQKQVFQGHLKQINIRTLMKVMEQSEVELHYSNRAVMYYQKSFWSRNKSFSNNLGPLN